ncbi:GNAT family N-acetyltransferase [Streptosporangium sp. CA-135522]|uniref:GNAT family N-acetyltransferase n=1 Tax=Streptosporangium sp. CA-135522 TaxID=3240072 RepID=UPI003D8FC521
MNWLDPAGIETGRLHLREFTGRDLPALERTWSDPEIRRHLGGPVDAQTLEVRRAEPAGRGTFVVTLADDGTVVGFCYLGRHHTGGIELSYDFLPEHWGHGYAHEACGPVLEWGFANVPDTGRIVAVTQEVNTRSRRLLDRLGMVEVDRFIEYGEPQVMYEIRKDRR